MQTPSQDKAKSASGRPQRSREAAFSLIELMIAAAILVIFASAALLAMNMNTSSALVTRNQTQARAIVDERLNQMLLREWKATSSGSNIAVFLSAANKITENVTVWQYTPNGRVVKVNGTVETKTEPDDDATNTRKVTVKLTYTFQGRTIEMDASTIRARDVN